MTITSITPRKDGKFLVGLHFDQGTSLRKVLTVEELDRARVKVEEQRARDAAYSKHCDKCGERIRGHSYLSDGMLLCGLCLDDSSNR